MKKREQISKMMTPNPITVNLKNKISEVANIFTEKNIRHIPVVSGTQLIGMLSKIDIERISFVTNIYNFARRCTCHLSDGKCKPSIDTRDGPIKFFRKIESSVTLLSSPGWKPNGLLPLSS